MTNSNFPVNFGIFVASSTYIKNVETFIDQFIYEMQYLEM